MIRAEVVSESQADATRIEDPPPQPARATLSAPPVRSIAEAFSTPALERSVPTQSEQPRCVEPVEMIQSPAAPAPLVARPLESGDAWARVLRAQGLPTVLRTLMTYLRPVSVDLTAGRIVLAGPGRYVESARGRHAQIVDVCRRELGRTIDVQIQSDDSQPSEDVAAASQAAKEESSVAEPGGDVSQADETNAVDAPKSVPAARMSPMLPADHPLVKEAMELFGARIVDVQHRRPNV